MANINEVSTQTFETEVLNSEIPVLVDFWAPWCQPCKMIEPMIEELSQEYNGKLKVVKVNTDEHPQIPTMYHVSGMPSLILFTEGMACDQVVGAVPKAKIKDMIQSHVH